MMYVRRLRNGIVVVVVPDPGEAIACVTSVHGMGYRNDPPGLQGLAHLAEHLLCRGENVQGATREDHLVLQAFSLPDDLADSLSAHAGRLRHQVVNEQAVRTHSALIREETASLRQLPELGFPWLPVARTMFGIDPLGDPDALARAEPSRVRSFLDDHLRPNTTAVVVSGQVDPQFALSVAEKAFSDLPDRSGKTPTALHSCKAQPVVKLTSADLARGAALVLSIDGLTVDPHSAWGMWLAARSLVGGPRPLLLELAAERRMPGRAVVSLGLVGVSWEAPSPTALCVGFLSPQPVSPQALVKLLNTASRAVPDLVRDADVVSAASANLLLDELALMDDPFARARRIGVALLRGGDAELALDPARLATMMSPSTVEGQWRRSAEDRPARLVFV
ncbi:M16 family metallopeptidase [Lentzea cavernae]|uniref:Peptidase M16 C-terminal domain-containing protein n=1 Tax=Lentzea cavernae TaxID=2020703 RepID=A0ABQ3M3S0_9PSEU|nr:insulinase family protein [Lentzea cavernae]GHH32443.1 hypothetical protein GCM10017774_13360 [Lentzea cavernae]